MLVGGVRLIVMTVHQLAARSVLGSLGLGGRSSAGRAPALQAGGRRFDPDRLHQVLLRRSLRLEDWPSYRGISEIGELMGQARSVPACHLPCVVFFVRVNQVLVRLWARVIGTNPFGLVRVPSFGCMSDRESCPSG